MANKFIKTKFSTCSLDDKFFDSLKRDYPEFCEWFQRKAISGAEAYVFSDEEGICAFVYLKDETESIELNNKILPIKKRLKIGTLKLANRQHGQRLGEGAIGIALWEWQSKPYEDIYLTVFPEHLDVINLVEKFGFKNVGKKNNGEYVYLKSKSNINYSTPHTAFPFINPNFEKAGIIPIYDYYHDRMFPYSTLKHTKQDFWEEAAGNGITKVFIGSPRSINHLIKGTPVFIYRSSTKDKQKQYYSCITSFVTISKTTIIKSNNRCLKTLNEFISLCGNKTIFTNEELKKFYNSKYNVVVFELVYNGFFGEGNNINYKTLKSKGYFYTYPYEITYTKNDFIKILKLGGINVQNIIID